VGGPEIIVTANRTKPQEPPTRMNPAKPQRLPDDRNQISSKDRVILVIEDDLKFAGILYEFMHERGFKCLLCEDGESGLLLALEFGPHGIILDNQLPGMSGLTVLSELKNNTKTSHIPVHMMSIDDIFRHSKNLGAIGCLKKPISSDEIGGCLDELERISSQATKKVLIIKNEEVQTKLIQDLIASRNVQSYVARTGKEAMDLLSKERFDCAILDLTLPDMSGFDLINRLQNMQGILPPPLYRVHR